ncbi:rod shape-determining protein MreC [Oceanobacillus sp. J11TS1]|uniref:rod shape-determining protein MreC n=1 Tax=Oceanobacillus sp. J11TS1 TaxID=2807191 RepID=UPI001B21C65E|nr:rod shape-determining protein MreC [Oceanobacillus sp. J11TS1]GIO21787.1 cell shape-determining protein MreC [Oceanobacillus sp. J11TS1]
MNFFRSKKLFVILIGFILLVVLIGYSLNSRGHLNFAEKVVSDAVGWVQNVVQAPVTFVTDVTSNISEFKTTYEENQVLREQLSQQKSLVYDLQKIEEENEELRSIIDMTNTARDYEPIYASVIARSPEQWVDQVTINRGTNDGVQENMVVRTAEGMIGKILHTSRGTSTVQLLTGFDEFNRVSATVLRKDKSDIFGMIEGFDDETEMLLFRIIEESDEDIKEGDTVYSSELGGEFPEGITIGEVKEVVADQYGLTRIAMVEPAADLFDIRNVIVVNRSMEQPEGEEEGDDES